MSYKKTTGVLCALLMAIMILPSTGLGAGTTGALFLNLGVNARSEAMGGAYAAVANDASSVTINPAGMVNVDGQQVSLMHNNYLLDIDMEYFSYVSSWGDKAYGMSLTYMDYGNLQKTSTTNQLLGNFAPTSYALAFAYGARSSDVLSYGVALKYVKMKIDANDGATFALDTGVLYKPGIDGLTLGVVLAQLGDGITLDQAEDPLPLTLKMAAAYEWDQHPLITTFDLYIIRDEDPEYHLGLQYTVSEIVPVRLGYNSDDDLDNGFTYGLGVEQPEFALDYAFMPGGEFGDAQRFSLLFKF